MKSLIVAGIGTDVGKTLVSAVLCQALGADYWKPVQSGIDDGPSDAETIRGLVTNGAVHVHPSVYSLRKSLSPHAAAAIEGLTKLPVLARIPHVDEVTPASVERVARGVRIDL